MLKSEHILAWIERNFDGYKIRKGGEEIVMANPWGDSGKHFNISLVKRKSKRSKRKDFWVHDWRPGHREHDGSFLRFVQSFKGCSFVDALKDVCGKGIDPRAYLRRTKESQEKAPEIPEETEISMPPGARLISEPRDTSAYKFATNYLTSRCISQEEAAQYYIHYNSVSIIFPYIEFGIVVYWQSRSMVGKTFEFPPETIGVSKSEFLYGFDQAEPGEPLILCEAIIDAINLGPGSVAIGGADLKNRQLRKIKALNPSGIILAADNDQPDKHGVRVGAASIRHNYDILRPYFQDISFCMPPDPYKDWNDMKVAGLDPLSHIHSAKTRATLRSLLALRNIT
jgi:hypothetical protein